MDNRCALLHPGAIAVDFTLPHTPRAHVTLHNLLSQPAVLVFYPMDWEPVSREQLVLYQLYADEFARLGARLLGISVDHVASHAAFARDAQIHFPLLADFQPRGAVARRYGVYRVSQGISARALFVVRPPGIICFSEVYSDLLNPGVNDIMTTLETIAAADAADMHNRRR